MAVHAAKRHGRERGEGEERQTTQTAAEAEGEGEKLPNAGKEGRETESKRANEMAAEDTETERKER